MDLEGLRALIAVIETGSFSAAAKSLRAARATLRRRIDDLEARSGVSLVRIGQEGAVATEAGKLLAARGRAMLTEAQALVRAVRELDRGERAVIKYVLPVGPPPHLIPLAADLIRTMLPGATWELRFSDDPLSEDIEDAAFAFHIGLPPPAGQWRALQVREVPQVLQASPAYLAKSRPSRVEDLDDHPLFVWRGPGLDPTIVPRVDGEEHPVHPAIITSDVHLLRVLAERGKGIIFAPRFTFSRVFYQGPEPEIVLGDQVRRTLGVWIVSPDNARNSNTERVLRAMLDFAETFLRYGE